MLLTPPRLFTLHAAISCRCYAAADVNAAAAAAADYAAMRCCCRHAAMRRRYMPALASSANRHYWLRIIMARRCCSPPPPPPPFSSFLFLPNVHTMLFCHFRHLMLSRHMPRCFAERTIDDKMFFSYAITICHCCRDETAICRYYDYFSPLADAFACLMMPPC